MTTTTIRTRNHGFFDRISAMFHALGEQRQRYALYRRTLRELESLSDRDLADLGLHGSMIRAIARDAAYGK